MLLTSKIHVIQTGNVRVKQFQVTGARSLFSRLWQLFFTQKWSDWHPVYCWLVEHPDGPFLIDAGEISKVHERGYLPESIGFKVSVQYDVKREDEVDYQLKKLGYDTGQIKAIFLTHFHSDHVDGLYHFPKAKIFASKAAYDFAVGPKGENIGYLKKNFPEWFQPQLFEFDDESEENFKSCKKMTEDGSIVAVPLPGHAVGHTAYIIKTDKRRYICSGDATFDKTTLQDGIPFVIFNSRTAEESVNRLQKFAVSPDVAVLCSHDPSAPGILKTSG